MSYLRSWALVVTWRSFNLPYLALPGCKMFVKSAQVTDIFTSDNAEQRGQHAEWSSKPWTGLPRGENTQPL